MCWHFCKSTFKYNTTSLYYSIQCYYHNWVNCQRSTWDTKIEVLSFWSALSLYSKSAVHITHIYVCSIPMSVYNRCELWARKSEGQSWIDSPGRLRQTILSQAKYFICSVEIRIMSTHIHRLIERILGIMEIKHFNVTIKAFTGTRARCYI